MCTFRSCLLNLLLAIIIIAVKGKLKVTTQPVETDCDHDFVEYFRPVPDNKALHTFRVVKKAKSFTLNIVMRAEKSRKVMYKIENLDGCRFINNPFMNKVLASTYNNLVVNHSFFKCPIPPGVYYLKDMAKALITPSFHPLGHYELTVQIKMSESDAPFVMQVVWKFYVFNIP